MLKFFEIRVEYELYSIGAGEALIKELGGKILSLKTFVFRE